MPIILDSATELRLNKLLSALSEYKGSDLHLTIANPPSLRIAGKLQSLANEALLTNDFLHNLIQALLTDAQLQTLELIKDVTTVITFKGKSRYKLHAYSQQGNYSLTFHTIPLTIPPLSRWTIHAAVQQCSQIQQGLVVVAGGYGAGKSTLVAGLVEELNQTSPHHIMTFEQPIEFVYTDAQSIIEQVEIGVDIPDVQSGLQRVYQEDVDVVVVNTALDAATMRTVLHFIEMGKLVILEVMAPTISLALTSMVGVFHAAEQVSVRDELATAIQAIIALQPSEEQGQAPAIACEVLRQNTATINFIKHESFDKISLLLENGRNDGMITFEQSLR